MMGTAGTMVQRVRVNVDELLDLLSRCAACELEIFYYYTIFSSHLIDAGEATLRDTIEKARIEDRDHFEQLVLFISEMGGEFPFDFEKFPKLSICSSLSSWDLSDKRMMVTILSEAEKCAVQTYMNICRLTEGKDDHTHRLISSLLKVELKHMHELLSFLEPGVRYSKKKSLIQSRLSASQLVNFWS